MSNTSVVLQRKIDTAKDLHSVVKTMKVLSASSIGQYEKSVSSLLEYIGAIELGLSVCLREIKKLPPKEEGVRMVIVFGSDQGLVGQFNEKMTDFYESVLVDFSGPINLWAVGGRIYSLLIEKGLNPQGVFSVPNSVDNIITLVEQILNASEQHSHISEFYLINHCLDGGVYQPISLRLLPLDEIWKERIQKIPWPSKNIPEVMGEDTFKALIREYLFIHLFRASAESLAAENTSRLRAMERADKNISELLEDLTGEFTHMRQTQIDEELFDVVSSFETLSKKRS